MTYFERLPVLMAIVAGMVTGCLCYFNGIENDDLSIRICGAIVSFFIMGILIKRLIAYTIENMKEEPQEENADGTDSENNGENSVTEDNGIDGKNGVNGDNK